ncbi:carboxymuconolactone decarboxylase family protein [Rhodophyticola porphyridii]|uniref:Carboxymuconolactone decarboxylase family protein n=1 Tax=Rhodophyticola porphyridii TaxID=1852017 RepID=A0A3L9YCT4_9RHOB|nr:carboxymuconolactone decarboxylase family protein [Rhodophyticola porphyridii]RMA43836.1 carboxymuconolactone decarboxylase family protein [Rhodophyticola porphyridii]
MNWMEKNAAMRRDLQALNGAAPDTLKGFGALSKAVKTGGALDLKTKEFVALGISVADRCEPCIGFHVEALISAGASREEIADVLSMAVQMGGGPSLMYAAKALACFDELSGATRPAD